MVTIKGTQEAKWKASYIVFEKLQKEGFAGNDEMRLRTGLYVPKNMVGRVIGKKGTNVRIFFRFLYCILHFVFECMEKN